MTKLTLKAAAEIVAWYRQAMGVEDWTIELYVEDERPAWLTGEDQGQVAEVESDRATKIAKVWLSNGRCKRDKASPVAVLCHELIHVSLADLGLDRPNRPDMECFVNRLEAIMAAAYIAEVATSGK